MIDGKLNVLIDEEVLNDRKKDWEPRKLELKGYLAKYEKMVTSASTGAILIP